MLRQPGMIKIAPRASAPKSVSAPAKAIAAAAPAATPRARFGNEFSSGRGSALRAKALSTTGATLRAKQGESTFTELVGLKKGATGELVERLQDRLLEVAPMTEAQRADMTAGRGTYGNLTEEIVEGFQRQQGLPVTGEIDAATAARLEAPLPPEQLARSGTTATRERVRRQAEDAVMNAIPENVYRHLPREDQAAIRAEAAAAGQAAVQGFNRDLSRLVDEELASQGLSRADLRNLPPEDREAILAAPTLSALSRINAQYDALDLSAAQLGEGGTLVNSNNGQSVSTDAGAWNNYCLAFVSTIFGRQAPDLHATSAINAANAAVESGHLNPARDYENWAPGTVVFFEATTANGQDGHIAIFTGRFNADGEPIIRTTGWPGHDGITEMPLSELEALSGAYTGHIEYPDVN